VNLPPQRNISQKANTGMAFGVADNTQHSPQHRCHLGATVAMLRNRNFPASLPQRKIPYQSSKLRRCGFSGGGGVLCVGSVTHPPLKSNLHPETIWVACDLVFSTINRGAFSFTCTLPINMNSKTYMYTSCTKDQAVAMLLGWSDEPIYYRSSSEYPTQEELDNIPEFYLQDELNNQLESLKDAYAEAKFDGMPKRDLEKKRSAINEFEKQIVLARTYLCDIDNELASNESILRIGINASNPLYDCITLASLKVWALKKYNKLILPNILIIDSPETSTIEPDEKPRPRQKLRDQEKAILGAITRLGHDPKNIPKNIKNQSGVKAIVRGLLKNNPIFEGSTVFDKAWERLRKFGEIATT